METLQGALKGMRSFLGSQSNFKTLNAHASEKWSIMLKLSSKDLFLPSRKHHIGPPANARGF